MLKHDDSNYDIIHCGHQLSAKFNRPYTKSSYTKSPAPYLPLRQPRRLPR